MVPNVTIKDIARIANVSYSTVSRALSGSRQISAETREKILRICEELGYTPNIAARSMVRKETRMIGLILANVDNPFMSELAFHIEFCARKHGYSLMLCNSSHEVELEREAFALLAGRQADGIIIVPVSADTYPAIKRYCEKIPTVFVSENLREMPVSYVTVDNFRGMFMGTEYLFELGHRDIVYIGRRKCSTTHQLRAKGYAAACEKLGITPSFFDSSFSSSSIQNGYSIAKNIFMKHKSFPYTGVLAATDTLALGIMQAADEFGYKAPEDFSLLGFDNIHYAGLPKINLSTIEQPKPAMAASAVEMLVEKMQNKQVGYSHRILTPTLIKRSSCLPLEQTNKSNIVYFA